MNKDLTRYFFRTKRKKKEKKANSWNNTTKNTQKAENTQAYELEKHFL